MPERYGMRGKRKSSAQRTLNAGNKKKTYLAGEGCDAGEEGCGAGVTGFELFVLGFTPDRTEPDAAGLEVRRTAEIESVIEVSINSTADHVVALESAVAAPRGPNAV